MTSLAEEPETLVATSDGRPLAADAPVHENQAWNRFLLERARESAWRPLERWRDEEGL